MNDEYIKLFDRKRNLLPVLSIEGRQEKQNVLMEEHSGGCVLFERRETVEALLGSSTKSRQ